MGISRSGINITSLTDDVGDPSKVHFDNMPLWQLAPLSPRYGMRSFYLFYVLFMLVPHAVT